ncbi:MAG: right-handed parallel beta-helix repeat-containing protein [Bacteroidota bacterium]
MRRIFPYCSKIRSLAILVLTLGLSTSLYAKEIHVAKTGNDQNAGTKEKPLLTINRAAQLAQPGDEITVHAGIYREWLKPIRSGESESKRIVYQAAKGEKVSIKGSEVVKHWQKFNGNIWTVEVPNTWFGGYNPYALTVEDIWMGAGHKHTRGDVYFNGEAFLEQLDFEWGIVGISNTWHSKVDSTKGITTLYANFGEKDPNAGLTEINVRKQVICPDEWNLKYITIRGFTVEHAANTYGLFDQGGAVSTKMGKSWIIENCLVRYARTVGIDIGWFSYPDKSVWDIFDAKILDAGKPAGLHVEDINAYGHHIIRNNIIQKCGEVGIYGTFAPKCIIENNLVEDINYKNEFIGHETTGIKTHNANDALFKGNLIRNIRNGQGIWLDWGNQGARVTGNVIMNAGRRNEYEVMVGPLLIDNNIFINCQVNKITGTNGQIFVNNLFVDTEFYLEGGTPRKPNVFVPHSTKVAKRVDANISNNQWFNNLFIAEGLYIPKDTTFLFDNTADYNVYWQGAHKSRYDQHSVESPFQTGFKVISDAQQVQISFTVDDALWKVMGPIITPELIGKNPVSNQGIETTVDKDFFGKGRTKAANLAGPFSTLKKGENRLIIWQRSKVQ